MIPRYRTKQFAHPSAFHFTAEASELAPAVRPLFGQVYEDAADDGLILVSDRTGREVRLSVIKEHMRDGDITHWELASIPEDTRRLRLRQPITMVIYND